MDTSNPVAVKDRVKIGDLALERGVRLRQDLGAIKDMASQMERNYMPAGPAIVSNEDATTMAAQFKKHDVDPGDLTKLRSIDFLEPLGPTPVSGLRGEKGPIHPEMVNQGKGSVSVQRVFGGSVKETITLHAALRHFPKETVQAAYNTHVYTRGNVDGFLNRLKKACTRTSRSLTQTMKVSRTSLKKVLALHMPVTTSALPDWNRPISMSLSEVELTVSSTAGFPYCRNQEDSVDACFGTVIPFIEDFLKDGSWEDLYKAQPELFLAECRNKQDRYPLARYKEKCRPYWAFPMHFRVFWSLIQQGFQKGVQISDGSGDCWNGYGFTMAHGGAADFLANVAKMKEGDVRLLIYGDDVDIVYRSKGRFWRVSPDFEQMDGSIDQETVDVGIEYMLDSFRRQYGDNPYLSSFAALWKQMAINAPFVVHGSETYCKKKPVGLLSGVVGTTYFDTVKSMLSYHYFLENHDIRTVTGAQAAQWFKEKCGLVIKPGTWNLEEFDPNPAEGFLCGHNKFLGVRWERRLGEIVPSLTDEEWLELLLAPRESPGSKLTETGKARLAFDRARGYLVTGAAFSKAASVCYEIINNTPSEIASMFVQDGHGNGTPPEERLMLGDYVYPASDAVPLEAGVARIYASHSEDFDKLLGWVTIFPGLREQLVAMVATHNRRFDATIPVPTKNVFGTAQVELIPKLTDVIEYETQGTVTVPKSLDWSRKDQESRLVYAAIEDTESGGAFRKVEGVVPMEVEDTIRLLYQTHGPMPLMFYMGCLGITATEKATKVFESAGISVEDVGGTLWAGVRNGNLDDPQINSLNRVRQPIVRETQGGSKGVITSRQLQYKGSGLEGVTPCVKVCKFLVENPEAAMLELSKGAVVCLPENHETVGDVAAKGYINHLAQVNEWGSVRFMTMSNNTREGRTYIVRDLMLGNVALAQAEGQGSGATDRALCLLFTKLLGKIGKRCFAPYNFDASRKVHQANTGRSENKLQSIREKVLSICTLKKVGGEGPESIEMRTFNKASQSDAVAVDNAPRIAHLNKTQEKLDALSLPLHGSAALQDYHEPVQTPGVVEALNVRMTAVEASIAKLTQLIEKTQIGVSDRGKPIYSENKGIRAVRNATENYKSEDGQSDRQQSRRPKFREKRRQEKEEAYRWTSYSSRGPDCSGFQYQRR